MNTPVYTYEQQNTEPKREFTLTECIYAWICFIAAYLFCRVSPVNENPAGGFLMIIGLYAVTVIFLASGKGTFSTMPIIAAVSAVIISASLIISDNPTIHFFAYTYAILTYFYFVYASLGNSLKKGFCDLVTIDYFKSLFIMPFASFGAIFRAVFTGKSQKGGRIIGKLFIGIAIAIIPTITVLGLLSYDADFRHLLDKLFDFEFFDIWSHFISLNFAIPLSAYAYGLFISSADCKCKNTITADGCTKASVKMKFAPMATILTATLPILGIYVIFFVSQWKYYVSGFTGKLPEGFIYSDYAREGFFQLCAVSVINLVIIALVMSLTKQKNKACTVTLKILCTLYSLATLVLISTALAKMKMYIDCYGLTPKRVYAAWFEIVLAIIFLLIILKQFIPKFNVVISSVAVLVVCFAVLALANVDGMIAEYNVDRYLNGTLDTVDLQMLNRLGDPAVPALIILSDSLEDSDKKNELYEDTELIINWIVREHESAIEEENIFSFTMPTYRARQAVKNRME